MTGLVSLWVLLDCVDLFALYWAKDDADARAAILCRRSRDANGVEVVGVRVQEGPVLRHGRPCGHACWTVRARTRPPRVRASDRVMRAAGSACRHPGESVAHGRLGVVNMRVER